MFSLLERFSLNGVSIFTVGTLVGISVGYLIVKIRGKADDKRDEYTYPSTSKNYRMILGVRTDLKMQKGKVAAQCAHAGVAAYVKCLKKAPNALGKWIKYGQAKITVKIDSEEEMLELERGAKKLGILCCIIRDAGHTQVEPDSRTVIAFGPAPRELIDQLTGHLKLY
ncbi:PREDICTED: peptidyl-tRNA hydrolase 2, mitochondrial-like [Nicrophorus vespilloides]|uniref:peptidyl-tRNA hydrolase n=1 Tax=Nicrophorus vespilloides TaxID=110193 RepID=A0ABM1NE42_NICVS|nr:PREDICTED: peptidyl-tRNA hydrolase 2, mitochondrial-like [Nicrophorus vespilloides]